VVRSPLSLLLLSGALALSPFAQSADVAKKAPAEEAKKMNIGSVAPAIDIEHWMSTGDGKFQPFSEFEPGKIYVVEFWATWCGPCIASMPHLVELQKRFADQGVTIVSVSDESLETVEGFLKREVMQLGGEEEVLAEGEAKPTYAELTSAYCLTTDPDASVKKDYFLAAGQNGIPCAFIVGKDGKIEWIGHPMLGMDEALEAVIAGTWDRDAFAIEFEQMEGISKIAGKAMQAAQKGDYAKFEEHLKEIQDLEVLPKLEEKIQENVVDLKNMALVTKLSNDPEGAMAELKARASEFEPEDLAAFGLQIAQQKTNGTEVNPEVVTLVTTMIEANKGDQTEVLPLLALGHLSHAAGDLDKGIAYLKQAEANATGENARFKPMIAQNIKKWEEEKAKAVAAPAEN
jgi:thiol-disulfide isomerase/thioredoxin